MINITFDTYCKFENDLILIKSEEFFQKIDNYNIIIKTILFENQMCNSTEKLMEGYLFKETIDAIIGNDEYINPYIEIIKNKDNIVIILKLFNNEENENIQYEWIVK